jgi:hypothetical protein
MDFRKLLEGGHSKANTTIIVEEVTRSSKKMEDLMACFIQGPVQITQRASWPISFIAQQKPELLSPYYPVFIELLNTPNKHNSINRNILRAFQFVNIPEEHEGTILDISFKLLNSNHEPIAVRVFSMTVIFNLTKKYPELIPELQASIEVLMPNASAGIKSRGNKILKRIQTK